jgi:hypothetical protein
MKPSINKICDLDSGKVTVFAETSYSIDGPRMATVFEAFLRTGPESIKIGFFRIELKGDSEYAGAVEDARHLAPEMVAFLKKNYPLVFPQ